MRHVAWVGVLMLAAACGDDENGGSGGNGGSGNGGGGLPAAMEVDDATVWVTLGHKHLDFGTNTQRAVEAEVKLLAGSPTRSLYPYEVGLCEEQASGVTRAIGTASTGQEVGTTITLSGGESFALDWDAGAEAYTGEWVDDDQGPWSLDTWYDVEADQASPPFTIDEAVYTTAASIAITRPGADAVVDVEADLEVEWPAGNGSRMILALRRLGAGSSTIVCAAEDDGAFTIPAEAMAPLVSGAGNLHVILARAYGWRLERGDEVIHLFSVDEVGHRLSE